MVIDISTGPPAGRTLDLSLNDATIGVLTALAEEFTAACEVLGCVQVVSMHGSIYKIGTVKRRDATGSHVVAVCRLSGMGNNTAAAAAVRLKRDCPNVTDVLMCGIAGAVPYPAKPSDHVRLGDIVASTEGVLQYDFERVSEGGVEMRPKTRLPSRRMVEAANLLQSDELRGLRPWDQYIAQATSALGDGWQRPHEESDLLCEFERSRPRDYLVRILRKVGFPGRVARYHPIPHPSDPIRRLGFPRIFLGVIASANRLQKDPAKRDLLRAQLRARAIEMEGSGIADAAYELDAEFLVVRGTCDYCNGDKNDLWHNYAAIVAAAYLRAFLEVLPQAPLLTGQGGGPNTSPVDVVPVQPKHEQAIGESAATDEAVAASVDSIVQRNISQVVGGALEDEARRRISSIREAIDTWEFGRASSLGADLAVWLEDRERLLSKPVVREVLEILVKAEIAGSAREPDDDSPVDTRRAEFYLSRLKDASRD